MHTKARVHADPVQERDHFDCLPDPLVLLILSKLDDVRSLGRCSAVSRRLSALVPLVDDVRVRIDRVVPADGGDPDADDALGLCSSKPRGILAHLLRLVLLTIARPFHDARGSAGRPLLAHRSPAQVLRGFPHLRTLRVELPAGDVGTEDGVLLRWRAEFGSSLRSCVILGGTVVDRRPAGDGRAPPPPSDDSGTMPESFYTNGGLKLRVVWTISCLIAASTRHYLLRSIIKEHPELRSLVMADADGQGALRMGAEQLRDFRENQLSASAACSSRTQVPACNMKLKYAPYLELPGGGALQGATLLVIRPADDGGHGGGGRKEAEAFVSEAFDGPLRFAVKALMKRRTYLLEMNGF